MGTNATFPPYEFVGDDGNVQGIDTDIAAAIADKLGMKLGITDMEFDSLDPALQELTPSTWLWPGMYRYPGPSGGRRFL